MQRAVAIDSDFRDTLFHNATLTGGSLEGARFDRAEITHSLLNGTHLTNTHFTGADLADSRFTNARLDNTDFSGALNLPDHLRRLIGKNSGSTP